VSEPRAAGEPSSRPFWVALVAFWAPCVWMVAMMGGFTILVLPAAFASAWLWFVVARWLEAIASPSSRLFAAAAAGLVSPPIGVLLAAACGTCSGCCFLPLAVPGLFRRMIDEPEWFFPFGLAMGLVAFASVSAPRARPPA
jgi:hypothetical protein